jgi:hypothetical protein
MPVSAPLGGGCGGAPLQSRPGGASGPRLATRGAIRSKSVASSYGSLGTTRPSRSNAAAIDRATVPRKGIEPSQTSSKRSEEAPSELEGAARKRHVTPQLARDIGPVLAQRLQARRPVSVGPDGFGSVWSVAGGRVRVPAILDTLESRSGPRYYRTDVRPPHRGR